MYHNKPLTRSTSSSTGLNLDANTTKRFRDEEGISTVLSLGDLWNRIETLVTQSNERLEEKIEKSKLDLENRIAGIEKQLTDFKCECKTEIIKLSEAVTDVRKNLYATDERVDRVKKCHELIISGVPFRRNEDLNKLFVDITTAVGMQGCDASAVGLKRLSKLPIVSGTSPPILCEFAVSIARDNFYRKYLTSKNLSLHHVGFDSNNRIYINENLSPITREIRAAAIKLKKQGHLQSVFTRNGAVYIKAADSPNATAVFSIDQLPLNNT